MRYLELFLNLKYYNIWYYLCARILPFCWFEVVKTSKQKSGVLQGVQRFWTILISYEEEFYIKIWKFHFYSQNNKLIFSLMNDSVYLNKWYLNISGRSDGEYIDHPVSWWTWKYREIKLKIISYRIHSTTLSRYLVYCSAERCG